MSEYYRTTYASGRKPKDSRSIVGILLDMVIFPVSLAVVALFVMTLLVPSVDPRNHGLWSILGHVAPFIYVAQIIVTLYWVVRWCLWIAVPMIIISMFALVAN